MSAKTSIAISQLASFAANPDKHFKRKDGIHSSRAAVRHGDRFHARLGRAPRRPIETVVGWLILLIVFVGVLWYAG